LFTATTILAVYRRGEGAIGGDGQVTFGENMIIKHNANKIRRIYKDRVLVGFAGSVADAITLFERFEEKLESYGGNLYRSAVEMTKEWRTDKYLRRLEAMLLAMDETGLLLLSGNGEVIEPDEGIAAIGSGGGYALAAARALSRETDFPPEEIVRQSLKIAAEICVYTNDRIVIEKI